MLKVRELIGKGARGSVALLQTVPTMLEVRELIGKGARNAVALLPPVLQKRAPRQLQPTFTFEELLQSGPASLPRVEHGSYTTQEYIKTLFRSLPPSIDYHRTGFFGNPLLTTPYHIEQYWETSHSHCESLLQEILSEPPSVDTIRKFDELSNALCLISDSLNVVTELAEDRKLAKAAEVTNSKALRYVEMLNTNKALFDAVNSIMMDEELYSALDQETRHVMRLFIFDFEQSGIHLDEKKREEFVRISDDLKRCGSQFVQQSYLPVQVPTWGVSVPVHNMLPTQGKFTVVDSSGAGHHDHTVREFMWREYHKPCEMREESLLQVLHSRQRLAQHVGFSSYAERELRGSMAGSVSHVQDFLCALNTKLKPYVDEELKHLEFAKARLNTQDHKSKKQTVYPWDAQFLVEDCRKRFAEKNCYSNGMFSDLMNIGNLMEGIVLFIENVYGLQVVPEVTSKGELWYSDVVRFSVRDKGEVLGFIYCDMFLREGVNSKMCLHTVHCGTKTQHPVVVIQGDAQYSNQEKGGSVSYVSYSQLQSLVHEFGHALHSMLGRTRYQHVSGTRCPTDMAEIPSILMENFLGHPKVFNDITVPRMVYSPKRTFHIALSEQPWINAPSDTENFPLQACYSALDTETHLFYSMLDLTLHSEKDIKDTTEVLQRVQAQYSSIPYVPCTAWQHRSSHLQTYGSRYYSYIWSKSISNMIYQELFNEDPYNLESGERVKDFLRQGSSRDSRELVEELLGTRLTIDNMVESLIKPIRHFNDGYLVHQSLKKDW